MKRIGLLLSVVAFSVAMASTAMAQDTTPDWANKNGAVGVGGNTTLGGSNGINIRTYVSPQFGLDLTLGFSLDSATVESDAGDTDISASAFIVGLYGEFKVAYWQRGSLAVLLGADIRSVSTETDAPGDAADTDASGTDLVIGLGFKGEYFPTQYLSLFIASGLRLDFIGEDEVNDAGGIDANEDTSGMSVDLFSQLEGQAGFTVWFK